MTGNQLGAEKDDRLMFREQKVLLFSKSKMATTNFSQSGAELRIEDGSTYERAAMLENSLDRGSGIDLTDFHGITNHAKMSRN